MWIGLSFPCELGFGSLCQVLVAAELSVSCPFRSLAKLFDGSTVGPSPPKHTHELSAAILGRVRERGKRGGGGTGTEPLFLGVWAKLCWGPFLTYPGSLVFFPCRPSASLAFPSPQVVAKTRQLCKKADEAAAPLAARRKSVGPAEHDHSTVVRLR